MALTDEGTNTTMLVQPSGFGNGGFGSGFGGDGWWVLLLLLAFGGGWGNGFGGGFGGGDIYPWLNNSQNINGGFRDQMLQTSVSSIGDRITSGFGDVQKMPTADVYAVFDDLMTTLAAINPRLYNGVIRELEDGRH